MKDNPWSLSNSLHEGVSVLCLIYSPFFASNHPSLHYLYLPRYCINFRPYGHAQATRKGFGANLLFNEHGGFKPLLESTLDAILRYPYDLIITAVRSLGERFAHVY
jgi:hypothetical protein